MSYKSQIPPSFGVKNTYADSITRNIDAVWGDKVTGNTDITTFRSGEITPPTIITFDRYKVSEMTAVFGWSLYIPDASEAIHFADIPNSELLDPQPSVFGYASPVSIDTSLGKVYQGVALDSNNYIFKNDNIVIVVSRESSNYPSMIFEYNGTLFASNSTQPISISNIGIVGNTGGTWFCLSSSIILPEISDQMYIGNDVSTPTV